MNVPIVFRPEARREVEEIYDWHERQREGLGDGFLLALESAVARIRTTPEFYPPMRRRILRAPIKSFPFVLYYQVRAHSILVLSLYDGHRRPRNRQERF